jgi:hypothetical protein
MRHLFYMIANSTWLWGRGSYVPSYATGFIAILNDEEQSPQGSRSPSHSLDLSEKEGAYCFLVVFVRENILFFVTLVFKDELVD